MKYYFEEIDSEGCYPKSYFMEEMLEREITEMKVYPAVIEYGTNYFWCGHYGEVGEDGMSCGKICKKYTPRNGKNGRCKHHKNCYVPEDKPIILKLKK